MKYMLLINQGTTPTPDDPEAEGWSDRNELAGDALRLGSALTELMPTSPRPTDCSR